MSDEAERVMEIRNSISPLLAGLAPEIQGAVLADLLATFLAGHYRLGPQKIEAILDHHISAVRKLVPPNIELLKRRVEQ